MGISIVNCSKQTSSKGERKKSMNEANGSGRGACVSCHPPNRRADWLTDGLTDTLGDWANECLIDWSDTCYLYFESPVKQMITKENFWTANNLSTIYGMSLPQCARVRACVCLCVCACTWSKFKLKLKRFPVGSFAMHVCRSRSKLFSSLELTK